jgi:hypothetical protein
MNRYCGREESDVALLAMFQLQPSHSNCVPTYTQIHICHFILRTVEWINTMITLPGVPVSKLWHAMKAESAPEMLKDYNDLTYIIGLNKVMMKSC